MVQTEYIRSLNSNYERLLLDEKPEERKYQYCMLSRGGIKGLLVCSLRYINGSAYLYYDITSMQNVVQLYGKRVMNRQWVLDFFWSFRQIQMELSRFLLDGRNVLWYPQQIYQDLESNIFSFLYVPYYEGESGFRQLLEYMVEHIDYEDELLVECVYKMYEQYEANGAVYLQGRILEDVKVLEADMYAKKENNNGEVFVPEMGQEKRDLSEGQNSVVKNADRKDVVEMIQDKPEKKGLFSLLEAKKKRDKEVRENYEESMQLAMSGYAVAEETVYEEEEWGKTIYVEEKALQQERVYRLCTPEGRVVMTLDLPSLTIGKKKGEVNLVLEDVSVSRMHARIFKEKDEVYLEDLNSTNGTFKNGLRMQPYEKRKLEIGDEIKFGKKALIFC